ncbi:Fucose permease (FucP) (PDB:3O7P) [Commensalibacter communis]|uniref:Fucose permease (FucP) n=1 Tax=Commensalibacter communis TaxID=2972786 RepID=A0A9W4TMF1_9PROT|nr:MFS transporter [Commensalibacter communis]CAI3947440.1 Fucose permease (FucP) (PDB:3O7P) [Commensalibacter communis]CAI3947917.1 Fucose permease (FucP) (PDB:3O7P) [Commensalibacter communis]CAI3949994.1 Fucose permease (FucP) (PDB:3O7P) [Commensalibacter communis]CAI3950954.1 Fucose permease (FucP) (PDB:3O7P) [Commensalibacter communis]CAI3953740.1 Fucose permease (FucP) (PDB:3O7P) [Commensalibacter communis]
MLQKYINDRHSTRIAFFIAGLVTAIWAVIVPFAKMNTGINDAVLGTLLLCLGTGASLAMPTAGLLTSRYGCKKVIIASVFIILITLPFLSLITHSILLAIFLFGFGIGIGLLDCVVNIQAVMVEKKAQKALMSGFHGMFSVGGIAGAGLMTGFLNVGVNIVIATLMMMLLCIAFLVVCVPHLISDVSPTKGPAFAIPRGVVLIIGIVCFIVFMVEGSALDWSAVYLVDSKHINDSLGGLGYVFFASSMTLGRLTGDYIIGKLGAMRVVIAGAIITVIGFYFVITGVELYTLLVGYLLIGSGCANIVPVMYNQVGKQNTMPQAVAVPAITTLGYLGILAGPAGIGFIAHHSSLSHAFIFVAMLMVVVLIMAIALRNHLKAG